MPNLANGGDNRTNNFETTGIRVKHRWYLHAIRYDENWCHIETSREQLRNTLMTKLCLKCVWIREALLPGETRQATPVVYIKCVSDHREKHSGQKSPPWNQLKNTNII